MANVTKLTSDLNDNRYIITINILNPTLPNTPGLDGVIGRLSISAISNYNTNIRTSRDIVILNRNVTDIVWDGSTTFIQGDTMKLDSSTSHALLNEAS